MVPKFIMSGGELVRVLVHTGEARGFQACCHALVRQASLSKSAAQNSHVGRKAAWINTGELRGCQTERVGPEQATHKLALQRGQLQ